MKILLSEDSSQYVYIALKLEKMFYGVVSRLWDFICLDDATMVNFASAILGCMTQQEDKKLLCYETYIDN